MRVVGLLRVILGAAIIVPMMLFGLDAGAQQSEFRLLKLGNGYVKWGGPTLGTGATVTYAFVGQRQRIAGARNCRDIVPIHGLLDTSGISWRKFREEVDQAFDMWEEASDIKFSFTEDTASADILIGAQGVPRGHAFTNVAFERGGDAMVGTLTQSLICLNPELPWKVGFDGNVDIFDLRYTIAHEAGHAIGLNHPGPEGQLMAFRYDERFRNLQDGDMKGAVALYGPRPAAIRPATFRPNSQ